MLPGDTIVAISSATGPAARMILRISGPNAFPLLQNLGVDTRAPAFHEKLNFSSLHCPAWIYQFVSPRSYTGEDLIELHVPGNPLLARMLLDWLVANGARPAEPGEFTARAFFNGKLDLSQAEGIASAISAQGDLELLAARRLMAGELAHCLKPAMDILADTVALVEAGIDFSEEQLEFLPAKEITARINSVLETIQSLCLQSQRLERLSHEPSIVLAGYPNAGKSTLTNALAGKNRSIVSPTAGTTRDVLSVEIPLHRGIARLIDIAGLSSSSESVDEIESQMRQAAERAVEEADVIVLVQEAADTRPELQLSRRPHLRIRSKIDLHRNPGDTVAVSAKTGEGLGLFRDTLDRLAFGSDAAGASLALTSRHRQALEDATADLHRVGDVLHSPEIIAAELRAALDHLGSILGIISPDEIIGKIFARFCIGK